MQPIVMRLKLVNDHHSLRVEAPSNILVLVVRTRKLFNQGLGPYEASRWSEKGWRLITADKNANSLRSSVNGLTNDELPHLLGIMIDACLTFACLDVVVASKENETVWWDVRNRLSTSI